VIIGDHTYSYINNACLMFHINTSLHNAHVAGERHRGMGVARVVVGVARYNVGVVRSPGSAVTSVGVTRAQPSHGRGQVSSVDYKVYVCVISQIMVLYLYSESLLLNKSSVRVSYRGPPNLLHM